MPKRVTGIAVEPGNPDTLYLSLEIGGLLRSRDGGKSWQAAIDGVYVVEDSVDLHGVVAGPDPGRVTITTRVGTFQSGDYGAHWRKLAVPALREKGSYCRAIVLSAGRRPAPSISAPAMISTATGVRSSPAATTARHGGRSNCPDR